MKNEHEKINFVNFSQLRSFYAVARKNSVTKAAELLNIGQPTVTTQLQGLEKTYDVQLFTRGPRSISLTHEGEQLYEIARQIFALEEQAVDLLKSHGSNMSGKLRVGTVGPHFVMDILAQLHAEYPLMQVYVESGNSETIYEKLLDFEVDVAITGSRIPDPRLKQVKLGRHEVIALVNGNHPWANRGRVRVEEFDGQRLIMREPGSMTRRRFEETLEVFGVRPNIVMELSRDALREAVKAGFGAGIISQDEAVPSEGLWTVGIKDNPPFTESHAACLKGRMSVRSVNMFMELVQATIPQADGE